jgi:hypothetical protein
MVPTIIFWSVTDYCSKVIEKKGWILEKICAIYVWDLDCSKRKDVFKPHWLPVSPSFSAHWCLAFPAFDCAHWPLIVPALLFLMSNLWWKLDLVLTSLLLICWQDRSKWFRGLVSILSQICFCSWFQVILRSLHFYCWYFAFFLEGPLNQYDLTNVCQYSLKVFRIQCPLTTKNLLLATCLACSWMGIIYREAQAPEVD